MLFTHMQKAPVETLGVGGVWGKSRRWRALHADDWKGRKSRKKQKEDLHEERGLKAVTGRKRPSQQVVRTVAASK